MFLLFRLFLALAIGAILPASAPAQVMPDMPGMHDAHAMPSGPLGISMDRMGSGTTWIPDAVSLPSRHTMVGSWELMLHGFAFLQYNTQGGPRGDDQFGSLNWAMLMASRNFAGGRLQLRTMLSLDPGTVTARGYPLLLQTGEEYRGEPIHDRQHPHDFWMELALLYEKPIARNLAVALYAAPSGEPALNPVAFMHRPSAMDDPIAPLGHHFMDATHITYGVVTVGAFTRTVKMEVSAFNGQEPDDRRWDFDRLRLNSYSARLTVNPDSQWSASIGYGTIEGAEAVAHAGHGSMQRVTMGILHGVRRGNEGQWATSFVVGANRNEDARGWAAGALLESELILDSSNTFMTRAEIVQRTGAELSLPEGGPSGIPADRSFNVGSLSLGYIREMGGMLGATAGVGVRGTVNFVPEILDPHYGSRTPLGALVFLRVRPLSPDRE